MDASLEPVHLSEKSPCRTSAGGDSDRRSTNRSVMVAQRLRIAKGEITCAGNARPAELAQPAHVHLWKPPDTYPRSCLVGRTGFLQRSGLNFPFGSFQIVHFVEMPIPGNEDHPVMLRRGSNPDVVLGQWPPLFLRVLLQTPVFTSNIEVARNHRSARRESFDFGRVLGRAA